ncbi:MAG TPA: AAA family ATPase [Thiopseudomonas sp.]|nr:AAA family ATPase [Thiopseudomonas sp.]
MTDLHADDNYLSHYQFEHDPFSGRGSSFKFFPAKRRSVLNELQHLARYSKLMLVVTGPQGSGKTVLHQALVAQVTEPAQSIVISANAAVDAASMLAQVSSALGLFDSEIADVLKHIEQMSVAGKEVHVLIDNAEYLEESALLFLQRLAQGVNDACARVVLFSDSSINPLLEKIADNADLHYVIALEPWDDDETLEYIEQRLIDAGQPIDVFSTQQLHEIYTQSQGWPGRVNSIAKSMLIGQMSRKSSGKKAAVMPIKYIMTLAVIALALVLFWLLRKDGSDSTSQQDTVSPVVEQLKLEPVVIPATPTSNSKIEVPLDLNPVPVVREPLAQALNAEEDEAQLLNEPYTDAQLEALRNAPAYTAEQEQQSTADAPQTSTAPAVEELPEPVPVPVVSVPVPVSTPPAQATTPVVQPVKKPVAKPAAVVRKAAAPAKPAQRKAAASSLKGTSGHSQWFKQQAPTRYTLQVFGTSSEAKAQAFVKQDSAQYHYFRKLHQGKTLFVVTYGSFADRASAHLAINGLPEKIRNDKPWIRTILSIQNELR